MIEPSTQPPPPPPAVHRAAPRRGRLLVLLVLFLVLLAFATVVGVGVLVAGGEGSRLAGGDHVAILPIRGVILDSKRVLDLIDDYAESDHVKAVVLRVDSPGGGVAPSQEIYSALGRLDEKKPVVASFGSTAASGGYYVACAARKIVSNPGSLTGSIGVILESGNYRGLLEKLGLERTVVKSGPFKDIMSPARPITPEEQALLQAMVDDVYGQFLDAVSEGRGIDREELRTVADGRVMSGKQALEARLVDELGGLEEAVQLAGEMAGLEDPEVRWPREPKLGLLERLLGSEVRDVASSLSDGLELSQPGLYFLTRL